jgi:hypothetical protein
MGVVLTGRGATMRSWRAVRREPRAGVVRAMLRDWCVARATSKFAPPSRQPRRPPARTRACTCVWRCRWRRSGGRRPGSRARRVCVRARRCGRPRPRWPRCCRPVPAPCSPITPGGKDVDLLHPSPRPTRQLEPADCPTSRSLSRGSYRPSPGGSTHARSAVDHPLGGRRVHPEASLNGDALCPYSRRASSELIPCRSAARGAATGFAVGRTSSGLTTSGQLIVIEEARVPKRRSSVSSAHATSSFRDTAVTISAEWGVARHRPIRSVEASPPPVLGSSRRRPGPPPT